jgi:DUF4097 and DUF4098 domain-containing protein YvlB
VADATGDVTAVTINGTVRILNTTAQRTVEVSTSNGAIEVTDTTGNLVLENENGRIDVDRVRSSNVVARTSNAPRSAG